MKLNLDAVVSNLAVALLECQALEMEKMVSVLAEVETLHLAAEYQGLFRHFFSCVCMKGEYVQRIVSQHNLVPDLKC